MSVFYTSIIIKTKSTETEPPHNEVKGEDLIRGLIPSTRLGDIVELA